MEHGAERREGPSHEKACRRQQMTCDSNLSLNPNKNLNRSESKLLRLVGLDAKALADQSQSLEKSASTE